MPLLAGSPSIYVPAWRAHDWRPLLRDPGLHWRQGYSAHALAHTWQAEDGFPPAVAAVLASTTAHALADLEMLLALPEHKVRLDEDPGASQTDLFVLARNAESQLVTIAVEGKAKEPFGPRVEQTKDSLGMRRRVRSLRATLGITDAAPLGTVRYQLLHRTAAAVLEARRFGASAALMLVHSFGPNEKSFDDYARFARLLGAEASAESIAAARPIDGLELFLGWVTDEAPEASNGARMNTASERELDLEHPDAEQIDVRDIAAGLSKVCRFGAQAIDYYSVAQHAVMVQRTVVAQGRRDLALRALHHDSHEAYTCDLPTPLKQLLEPAYGAIGAGLDRRIAERFGFRPLEKGSADQRVVKEADNERLRIEAARLLPDHGRTIARERGWPVYEPRTDDSWEIWAPARAEQEFRSAHDEAHRAAD